MEAPDMLDAMIYACIGIGYLTLAARHIGVL